MEKQETERQNTAYEAFAQLQRELIEIKLEKRKIENSYDESRKQLDQIGRILKDYAYTRREMSRPDIGINAWGHVQPYSGSRGGDLWHVLNFEKDFGIESRIKRAQEHKKKNLTKSLKRHRKRVGFLALDATGHSEVDALTAGIVFNAFVNPIPDHLDHYGQITTRMFDNVNQSLFRGERSMSRNTPFIYGEVTDLPQNQRGSAPGELRFISGGHPYPMIYRSATQSFEENKKWQMSSVFGMGPSENISQDSHPIKAEYIVNHVPLYSGDIVLVCSDGVVDHGKSQGRKMPIKALEETMRNHHGEKLEEIGRELFDRILTYDGMTLHQDDDMTIGLVQYLGPKS